MDDLKKIQRSRPLFSCKKSERGIDFYVNQVKLDRFDLLACASRAEDYHEAWEILHFTSKLYHPQDDETFNVLYGNVAMEVTRRFNENEFTIQHLFKENVEKILGENCHLILHKKNNPKHIPDAWISDNGQEKPVEAKLGTFDAKALKQLQRYMRVYGCICGIAIGRTLGVEIPNNINFISISRIKEVTK